MEHRHLAGIQWWPALVILAFMGTQGVLCAAVALPEAEPLPLAFAEPEALPQASPWPEPIPMPWAFPDSDPEPLAASSTGGGCGPPRLSSPWPNITASHGQPFKLSCPLDTRNSCLIDRVEWYFSAQNPGVPSSGIETRRKLLKHMALAFDPLMLYFPSVSQEHSGWYTCMVGNTQGMSEASSFLDVRHRRGTRRRFQSRPSQAVPQRQQQQRVVQVVPTQTQSQISESREETESQNGVQSRFSVYARFRGDRGFRNPNQAAPQALQRRDPIQSRNNDRNKPVESVDQTHEQGLDAVHQHLRYIYDKVDQIDNQMTNIEQRISRLERN
ncbi:uncharacterized protein LOC131878163 [Tigriopus californicus]|uniref:uncharacterized protein LOC131878163 n=1 Tax=Tigriopus californicus TaxID=6832 RepID=UPI0027DA3F18|nr:uncharacterized protein LOC131878163 [Tigriopus californicus]